jgi:hypothetical protein
MCGELRCLASPDPIRLSGTMTNAQVNVRPIEGQNRLSPPWNARSKLSSPTQIGARMMLYRVNARYRDHNIGPRVHSTNPRIQGEAQSHP